MDGRARPFGRWQSARDKTRTNKNPARWPGLFVDSHAACATAYPAQFRPGRRARDVMPAAARALVNMMAV
jgi:hypothetical protein